MYAGQAAKAGSVLVRQRGTRILAGENVGIGVDHTLYALTSGTVTFTAKRKKRFDGKVTTKRMVHVLPA